MGKMYLKSILILVLFLCYVKAFSSSEELSITTEPDTSNITNVGAREYLSPNLVALYNMAIIYLPKTFNFLNIIEAYKELIDGVRYQLLVNTTNDKNDELICRIVVKEMPLLINTWGDKNRELIYTNCTVLDDNNNSDSDLQFINKKYKTNTLFNKDNREITYDNLSFLESQILEPKPKTKLDQQEKHDYTTSKTLTVEHIDFLVTTIPPTSTEISETESTVQSEYSTEDMSGIDKDSIYFLDNFFSFYNFGPNNNNNQQIINSHVQIENKPVENISATTGESNSGESSSGERIKRSIPKHLLDKKEEHLFNKFVNKYNKDYINSLERQMRYRIFKSNLIKIKQLNDKEQGTAKYGITELADLTLTEYKMRTGLLTDFEENRIKNPIAEIPDIKLPESFDWRKKDVISEVKNQGSCGSCWAFSVIGNIEGLNAIKTGKLEEFSEQELVDCDTIDSACGGGLMDNAYKAIESIGGLEYEAEYPYKAHKEKCIFNSSLSHLKIKGGIDLPKNETAMALWLVANGPISIGINANAMQFYRGGISHPWSPLCRHGGIDHGVLIVGFGKAEYPLFNKTLPYWIVKNSWGPTWGEQGYYRVFRGDNTCGVNSMASSAVL